MEKTFYESPTCVVETLQMNVTILQGSTTSVEKSELFNGGSWD